MSIEIKAPAFPESVADGEVAAWHKSEGDSVSRDELIVEIETDKVVMEVVAPANGVLDKILVQEGDTIESEALLAVITEGAAADSSAESPAATAGTENSATAGDDANMGPAARQLIEEHRLDASKITGTGKGGRITKEDVLEAAKNKGDAPAPSTSPAPSPAPAAAPASTGERHEERVKMTRMRQTIAKRLKGAQDNAALLTTFNDCDMSAVIEARGKYKDLFAKKHDIRLGFMGFFAKAACLALKDVPAANAYIEGDEIVYHDYVDISVAVSAPNGLVVPVIRDCQDKGFARIEKDIADFGKRAKEGSLTMADMQGGTFTISNGGVFGSLMSTPIINPPQSAVLGLHRIEDRPVVIDGEIVIRPMMYLALSYDHRLIDGREAVTALKIIKDAIEDPTRMLIDL